MVLPESSDLTVAIRNAVRSLKQLGQSFEKSKFKGDDLSNIDHVAETLIALEKEIGQLHSELETESIESSRLRHRLKSLPIEIKNEIQAAVIMARESNVTVIQNLQKELDGQLEQVRRFTTQENQLNEAIGALQSEKNSLQSKYDTTIYEVNQRISEKASLQINLNETRDTVRETNEHTFDLEEEMTTLKERLMQERNDARQEKVRIEEECAATVKRYEQQERANQLLKKDVDQETHKVSESEMQLRSMYRERERFENEALELQKKLEEQNEFYQMETREHDAIIRDQLRFTEQCGIALLDYQTKKEALLNREKAAHERTNEETENLKVLKHKHEELLKVIEDELSAQKLLETTIGDTGKELEEIKQDIAKKLEKTAQLNLDNAETSRELEAMREAHQTMIDSLKMQMNTLDKELNMIREERVNKQKDRENLLKTIEQTRLTSRNNDIRHNRFVTQTTARVNELTERKSILDRNAREDQIQIDQLDEKLSALKIEYRQMKITLNGEIQNFQQNTKTLKQSIEENEKKIEEETPEFERLTEEHRQTTHRYETTKEKMIETKRKKQELLDRIENLKRTINEKNTSRDLKISTIKERQREFQQQVERSNQDLMILEKEIYDKGCRLETLEFENEQFEKTIAHLRYEISLFNLFSDQSNSDMKILDENNVQLIGELSVGWKEDRTLESRAAEQDLVFIKALENLLEQTEKRKNKVGSVVYQLLGELQQLKYYLEGMSDPVATAKVEETIEENLVERSRSSLNKSPSPNRAERKSIVSRPASASEAEQTNNFPIHLTKAAREKVSRFVEENFYLRSQSAGRKTPKKPGSFSGRSEKTAASSAKSISTEENRSKTPKNLRVAFV